MSKSLSEEKPWALVEEGCGDAGLINFEALRELLDDPMVNTAAILHLAMLINSKQNRVLFFIAANIAEWRKRKGEYYESVETIARNLNVSPQDVRMAISRSKALKQTISEDNPTRKNWAFVHKAATIVQKDPKEDMDDLFGPITPCYGPITARYERITPGYADITARYIPPSPPYKEDFEILHRDMTSKMTKPELKETDMKLSDEEMSSLEEELKPKRPNLGKKQTMSVHYRRVNTKKDDVLTPTGFVAFYRKTVLDVCPDLKPLLSEINTGYETNNANKAFDLLSSAGVFTEHHAKEWVSWYVARKLSKVKHTTVWTLMIKKMLETWPEYRLVMSSKSSPESSQSSESSQFRIMSKILVNENATDKSIISMCKECGVVLVAEYMITRLGMAKETILSKLRHLLLGMKNRNDIESIGWIYRSTCLFIPSTDAKIKGEWGELFDGIYDKRKTAIGEKSVAADSFMVAVKA